MEGPVPDDLEAARAGDREAVARLLEPLLDPGYRLALAMLRRPEAAQDAVQDSCLNALRAIPRFRGESAGLRPWFLTIVRNTSRSQMRRRFWRWTGLNDSLVSADGTGPVAGRHDLRQALSRLRPGQRTALALFYYLDLPMDEVAQVLRISEPAARSRVYRAVSELRSQMEEGEP
jgi:DNA-directed RNA polymerase specialized sigma24 family protein